MGRYTLSRLAQLLPVLWLISLIIFVVMHALPGDPAELMLAGAEGGAITPERLAEIRTAMGLDDPLAVQYLRFLTRAVVGDLGESLRFRIPVSELILDRFASTLGLSLCGLLIAVAIGLPLGMLAAVRQNSWIDALSMASAYLGASMPVFWLGLLLILAFASWLRWFPATGYGFDGAVLPLVGARLPEWRHLALPALTLALVLMGSLARVTRAAILDVAGTESLRAARARGVSRGGVLLRHALRRALPPVVTVLGLQLAGLVGGAVVVEVVFAWPGLGRLVYNAVAARDYPVIQGAVLLIATLFLLINLVVDALYAVVDPRIRLA